MSTQNTLRTEYSGRRSTRKTLGSAQPLVYHIYCINFYDNGLRALKDEFVSQVRDGLRRFIFVIDLDDEVQDVPTAPDPLHLDAVGLTKLRIANCLNEYQFVTRKIEAELSFNLLKYYQRYVPLQIKLRSQKEKGAGMESKRAPPGKKNTDTVVLAKITCFGVAAKEHNKVGKGSPLSKRTYIKDNPENTTILILIVGQITNEFYKELLRRGEPLAGIVHFLPEKCAYDFLVPRPRREKELRETIEGIQADIHSLRKRILTKPVGIFQQQLPQLSICQAAKHWKDIFDQLTWYIYDMQTLREQYQEYYVKPYVEIDVRMSPDANLKESRDMAESRSILGHYLDAEVPVATNDDASIYLYLESLLCTFGNPKELMTEMEVLLLANPNSSVYTTVLDKIKVYAHAFKSIVKLPMSERLFVENANPLLNSIISYMDQRPMTNLYHACLEYNVLRRYFTTGYILDKIHFTPFCDECEPEPLPKFGKLYLTDDSVNQRIIQLINEYESYTVEEVHNNVRLYTFRRALNEVLETQKEVVIPTCLCFRDFTLYDMQLFLHDLVTPQMADSALQEAKSLSDSRVDHNNIQMDAKASTAQQNLFSCPPRTPYTVQPSAFIRPNSLKEKKLKTQNLEKKTPSRFRIKDSLRETKKSIRSALFSVTNSSHNHFESAVGSETPSEEPPIGLGPDHPLLKGYNLGDARQTVKTKTSNFFFEEGKVCLYEEKWNFRQLNKSLSIEVNKESLHLTNEPGNMGIISPNIRIQTRNGISLRILPDYTECAKAVLQYPNGLTLYCQNTYGEHLWSSNNQLDEKRRLCTPYGCVIVFYNNVNMVLIMRYNGEVYRLYQESGFEDAGEEEEMETSQSFIKACSTQSTYSSYKPLARHAKKVAARSSFVGNRTSGGADSKIAGRESNSSSVLEAHAVRLEATEKQLLQKEALFCSIDAEIRFLEFIMDKFNLTFQSLKLTTSLGSVVHVEGGEIRCLPPLKVTEWHDYFANESYAMRDDGLHIVWTADSLRCYHNDGTLITTKNELGWDLGIVEDEIDKQISSSSSHVSVQPRETINKASIISTAIFVNTRKSSSTLHVHSAQEDEMMAEMEQEHEYMYDYGFTTYGPTNFLIEHQIYAATEFTFPTFNMTHKNLETKVYAADELEFSFRGLKSDDFLKMTTPEYNVDESSEADMDFGDQRVKRPSVLVTDFKIIADISLPSMKINFDSFQMNLEAKLRKFGCEENQLVVHDIIKLQMETKNSLNYTFNNWVEEFHKLISCRCPKSHTSYFVEAIADDCRKKGLELMKSVPKLGKYQFVAGNYFIDPAELFAVPTTMEKKLKYRASDMEKFPRFGVKEPALNIIDFPTVLSTTIFVEIPAQLAYADRIHKVMYPFEELNFRNLKHRYKEAVFFHLHPQMRNTMLKEISKRSWRNRHMENKRRQFLEQQRLSLYVAMLNHKVYPNYFEFRDQYHGHVRNIDFFEFMSSKCNKPQSEVNEGTAEGGADKSVDTMMIESGVDSPKKRRKKCPCPKYLKSLT